MNFSRRKLIEDRDTILELTAKIQELQNEINCMNDSRDFKDAESVRSGLSHVPTPPTFFSTSFSVSLCCCRRGGPLAVLGHGVVVAALLVAAVAAGDCVCMMVEDFFVFHGSVLVIEAIAE